MSELTGQPSGTMGPQERIHQMKIMRDDAEERLRYLNKQLTAELIAQADFKVGDTVARMNNPDFKFRITEVRVKFDRAYYFGKYWLKGGGWSVRTVPVDYGVKLVERVPDAT